MELDHVGWDQMGISQSEFRPIGNLPLFWGDGVIIEYRISKYLVISFLIFSNY